MASKLGLTKSGTRDELIQKIQSASTASAAPTPSKAARTRTASPSRAKTANTAFMEKSESKDEAQCSSASPCTSESPCSATTSSPVCMATCMTSSCVTGSICSSSSSCGFFARCVANGLLLAELAFLLCTLASAEVPSGKSGLQQYLNKFMNVEFACTFSSWFFGLVVIPSMLAMRAVKAPGSCEGCKCWLMRHNAVAFSVARWAVAYLFMPRFSCFAAVFSYIPERLFHVACVVPAVLGLQESIVSRKYQ
jgi:hypothetical protein